MSISCRLWVKKWSPYVCFSSSFHCMRYPYVVYQSVPSLWRIFSRAVLVKIKCWILQRMRRINWVWRLWEVTVVIPIPICLTGTLYNTAVKQALSQPIGCQTLYTREPSPQHCCIKEMPAYPINGLCRHLLFFAPFTGAFLRIWN